MQIDLKSSKSGIARLSETVSPFNKKSKNYNEIASVLFYPSTYTN